MDGWDEWMDGWMDGCMNGWTDGRMVYSCVGTGANGKKRTYVSVDERVGMCVGVWTYWCMCVCAYRGMFVWLCGCVGGNQRRFRALYPTTMGVCVYASMGAYGGMCMDAYGVCMYVYGCMGIFGYA